MEYGGSVYIITNRYNTTLYTGVTSELFERMVEHREKHNPKSFSARYNLYKLVYFDCHPRIEEAIAKEKYIKGKSRKWKISLITQFNPNWEDLFYKIKEW